MMMARIKFSQLCDTLVAKPGAPERVDGLRAETLEEIRLYELRHGEAISQAELAGRLDVTQGAISKLQPYGELLVGGQWTAKVVHPLVHLRRATA